MTPPGKVVLLATAGEGTNVIYHALAAAGPVPTLVLETPVPRSTFLRRRAKRLGVATATGQALFMVTALPTLRWQGRERASEICRVHALDRSPIDASAYHVDSANGKDAQQLLATLTPDVVVINGTRILSTATLDATPAPFLNMHAGITPAYRGVHGGYWALADGRRDLVGTTIHYVDKGIDTGAIIGQTTFAVEPRDSFATYPLLHIAAGLPMLLDAVAQILAGAPPSTRPPLAGAEESKLRSHPTLWEYVGRRVRDGVA
jgi:methionyl-tRNA formyltransferase